MSYSTANIRQFMMDHLSDDEITALSFDYVRPVFDNFAQGMNKGQKIQALLEYCDKHGYMENLLAALQIYNPTRFKDYFAPIAVSPELAQEKQRRNTRLVFICHAHQDAEFAHRLAADLRKHCWQVWIAPESIQPGEKWEKAIQLGLARSGVIITLLTPDAVHSRWVMSETNEAVDLAEQNQIRFIPIELESCSVPDKWHEYQRLPVRGESYAADLRRLLQALDQVSLRPRLQCFWRHYWWIGAGLLALILLLTLKSCTPAVFIDNLQTGTQVDVRETIEGHYTNMPAGYRLQGVTHKSDGAYYLHDAVAVGPGNGAYALAGYFGDRTYGIGEPYQFFVLAVPINSSAEAELSNRVAGSSEPLPADGVIRSNVITVTRVGPVNKWYADYWADVEMRSGDVRYSEDIEGPFIFRNWSAAGSPNANIPESRWTARFVRRVPFLADGVYRFYAEHNHGVRVWVDNNLVIDAWNYGGDVRDSKALTLTQGYHEIAIAFSGLEASPDLGFWYEGPEPVPVVPRVSSEYWQVAYYPNLRFKNDPIAYQTFDAEELNLHWGDDNGAPVGSGAITQTLTDYFSTRSMREMAVRPGRYQFDITGDSGVALKIDEREVFRSDEAWIECVPSCKVQVDLSAVTHTLTVDHWEDVGNARVSLTWMPVVLTTTIQPAPSIASGTSLTIPVSAGMPVPLPNEAISATNADRIVQLARWGKGRPRYVTYSPDGKYLAVCSTLGIYVYDPATNQEVGFIDTGGPYYHAAFVPGHDLLLISRSEAINLQPVLGGPPKTFGALGWNNMVAASRDGKWLASGRDTDQTGGLQMWNWENSSTPHISKTYTSPVNSLAFAPGSSWIAIGFEDGSIRLLNYQDLQQAERVLQGHQGPVWDLVFSSQGTWLASNHNDEVVDVWRWQDTSAEPVYSYTYTSEINTLAFGPGTTEEWLTLGLWADEREVKVVSPPNTTAQQPPFAPLSYRRGVQSVAYAPDGNTLAVVADDGTVEIRRSANWQQAEMLPGFTKDQVTDLLFVANDEALWSGMWEDLGVREWRVADGQSRFVLNTDLNLSTGHVAISPDLNRIAVPKWDQHIEVWDREKSERTPLLDLDLGSYQWPRSVAFADGGKILAAGTAAGSIWIWRLPNDLPSFIITHTSASNTVTSIAFSPNGQLLAAGSDDGLVRLWGASATDHARKCELPPQSKEVSDVAFNTDGTLMAVGVRSGKALIVNTGDCGIQQTFENGSSVNAVAFSPQGDVLAAALEDGTVKLWPAAGGDLLARLDGHVGSIQSIAFSQNGRLLASGSYDATIGLWGITPK